MTKRRYLAAGLVGLVVGIVVLVVVLVLVNDTFRGEVDAGNAHQFAEEWAARHPEVKGGPGSSDCLLLAGTNDRFRCRVGTRAGPRFLLELRAIDGRTKLDLVSVKRVPKSFRLIEASEP